jgi:hypothetical protein
MKQIGIQAWLDKLKNTSKQQQIDFPLTETCMVPPFFILTDWHCFINYHVLFSQ